VQRLERGTGGFPRQRAYTLLQIHRFASGSLTLRLKRYALFTFSVIDADELAGRDDIHGTHPI
jgi:hypothetical protein